MAKIQFFAGVEGDEFRFETYIEADFVPTEGTRVCITHMRATYGKIYSSFYSIPGERWEAAILLDRIPDLEELDREGWRDNYSGTEESPDDESGDSLFIYPSWQVWRWIG
jgi:hypothetical protein